MRILLDTNLLVRAAISRDGLAREILRLIESGKSHVLLVSPYLLSEVADVLRRDRIRARWPLTDDEVRAYCRYLSQAGEEVSPQSLPPVIKDPKDQAIVETAVTGKAAVICTSDAHFFDSKVLSFCAAHAISVMDDRDLLRALRADAAGTRETNPRD